MSRIKTILRAPEGADESVIQGTTYWPDEDGLIECTNIEHVPILKQHGYVFVQEMTLERPNGGVMIPIEHEELGRQAIAEALEARGVNYPATGSRADLAEIAESWNRARARRPKAEAVAAPERPLVDVAGSGAVDPEKPDFSATGIKELKAFLVARGVMVPPGMPKNEVQKLAEDTHAELLKAKAAA
jgi:hypothetical protein